MRTILLILFMSLHSIVQVVLGETTDSTITVTTTGFQFQPQSWTVNSGKKVTVTITNMTVQEHEWVLLKAGTKITLPFGEDDEQKVYWQIQAKAGEIKEGTFFAPLEPGTYDIICGKPRHMERGMKATFTVK